MPLAYLLRPGLARVTTRSLKQGPADYISAPDTDRAALINAARYIIFVGDTYFVDHAIAFDDDLDGMPVRCGLFCNDFFDKWSGTDGY